MTTSNTRRVQNDRGNSNIAMIPLIWIWVVVMLLIILDDDESDNQPINNQDEIVEIDDQSGE